VRYVEMAINAVSLLFRQVGIQFIRSKIDSASILKARSGDLAMRLVSVKSRALALREARSREMGGCTSKNGNEAIHVCRVLGLIDRLEVLVQQMASAVRL
jgi:hypothetical protein